MCVYKENNTSNLVVFLSTWPGGNLWLTFLEVSLNEICYNSVVLLFWVLYYLIVTVGQEKTRLVNEFMVCVPYCMGVKVTWLLWSTEANATSKSVAL